MIGFGIFNRILRYLDRILIPLFGIDGNINLASKHLQLFDSCRTVHVGGHKQRTLCFLAFEFLCEFTRHGGLTGSLKTGHQYHSRITGQVQSHRFATHESGKFVMDYLHHQLARFDGINHILTQSFGFNSVGKLFGDLKVDVRVKKSATYIFKSFSHIYFSYTSLSFKELKASFKSFAKIFKHDYMSFK